MKNEIEAMIMDITTTTAEAEDYTGEDGLLYCGKCHTPKEAYFAEGKTCFGRDRHPTDCDCQRAAREKQQAAESRQKHLETVDDPANGLFRQSGQCGIFPCPLYHALGRVHVAHRSTGGGTCQRCTAGLGEQVQDRDRSAGVANLLCHPVPVHCLLRK